TEEVAQSAVHLRQMGCTMLKDEQHRVAPIIKGGLGPPLTPSPNQQKKKTIPPTISTNHNDMTINHQKYEHQPTLVASHLTKGIELTTNSLGVGITIRLSKATFGKSQG
ncbi:hypothetical protein KCU78_g12098, partial [Aureobasidium melanogenum]